MAPTEEGNLHVRCQQHQDGVLHYLGQLLTSQAFADVTICCQNRRLKAHRILLSACSHYLQRVLLAHLDPDHITLILHDIDYCDMKLLLDFMYTGAVSVSREGLPRFLQAAETLQVRVLNRHTLAKTDCDINTAKLDPKKWSTPTGLDVRLKTDCDTNPTNVKADCKPWPACNETLTKPDVRLKTREFSGEYERPRVRSPDKMVVAGMVLKKPPLISMKERHPALTGNTFTAEKYTCPENRTAYKQRGSCCGEERTLERKYHIPAGSQHIFINPQHTSVENRTEQSKKQPQPCDPRYSHVSAYPQGGQIESDFQHIVHTNHISEHPIITLCNEHQRCGNKGVPQWARPLPCLMPIATGVPERSYNQLKEGVTLRNGLQDLTRAPPPPKQPSDGVVTHQGLGRVVPKVPRLTPILPPSPWVQHNRPPCVAPRMRNSRPVRHWNPGLPQEASIGQDIVHHRVVTKEQPPTFCRLKERRLQEFYRDQRNTTVEHEEASDLSMKGRVVPPPSDVGVIPPPRETFHPTTDEGLLQLPEPPSSLRVDGFESSPRPTAGETLYAAEQNREMQRTKANNNNDGDDDDDDDEVIEVCDTVNDRNNNNAKPAMVDGKTAHCCEDCGKCFSRRQLLVQHRRIHTGERPYTCAECGKQFTQRGHWSSHQKLHGPARRPEHACSNCGKGFVTRASLKVHLRTHTGEKPFQCTECGKQFSQLRNYKYHRSVHEGTREFAATCPECGKYFNDRGYLSSHMKIHRNRKEYACQYCGKSFNQRVAYNMHVRIHTGERPHSCQHCNKSFSRKMLLKQHLRIHTGEKPFACEVCGKAFADRSNMTLHMRLHSGIKPYTCSTCNKSFTKKHHLKTHMNYHTGIKPYACAKCGLRFSQSSNMRTHYKKCSANHVDEGTTAGSVLTTTTANDTTLPSDVITPPHSDDSSCASSVTNQTG